MDPLTISLLVSVALTGVSLLYGSYQNDVAMNRSEAFSKRMQEEQYAKAREDSAKDLAEAKAQQDKLNLELQMSQEKQRKDSENNRLRHYGSRYQPNNRI